MGRQKAKIITSAETLKNLPVNSNLNVRSLAREKMMGSKERGKMQTWGKMERMDMDR
jgi:hypothetical protein